MEGPVDRRPGPRTFSTSLRKRGGYRKRKNRDQAPSSAKSTVMFR